MTISGISWKVVEIPIVFIFIIHSIYPSIFTSKIQLSHSILSLKNHCWQFTRLRRLSSEISFSLRAEIWILEILWHQILSFHV
jgi:hypothetical protein